MSKCGRTFTFSRIHQAGGGTAVGQFLEIAIKPLLDMTRRTRIMTRSSNCLYFGWWSFSVACSHHQVASVNQALFAGRELGWGGKGVGKKGISLELEF